MKSNEERETLDSRRTGRCWCDTCDCDLEFYFLRRKGKMFFVLIIITNILITFIILRIYSYYLAKELDKMENRILYLQLKTILQKDFPSVVKE